MSRTDLILVIAALLFAAFALGWIAHWLVRRISRVDQSDLGELEKMAQALNEAEELRDQALVYIEDREATLMRELGQTRAELEAAMDGLRSARAEAEHLRRALEGRG